MGGCWRRALGAVSALLVAANGNEYLPPSFPLNRTIDVDMDSENLIPLHSVTPLPEPGEKGGQLNWPIFISPDTLGNENRFDDWVVGSVSVKLRGLYHEHAGDLDIKLLHDGSQADLSKNRGETRHFGEPRPREYEDVTVAKQKRRKYAENIVEGVGFDYSFADLVGNNLASGRDGEQSSSMSGDKTAAWRATDGDVVSSGVATHTEINPWYQVDLGSSQDLGTIVLWAPDPENQVNEIQVVKTTGLVTLGGSFRLSLHHNGFTETTEPIQHNAVQDTLHEDWNSNDPGIGKGESMQAKIQALGNVGLVSVTRSLPDRTGGYEWTITFLTEHSNINEMEIAENDLTAGPRRLPEDQVADVTVTSMVNGTQNTYYNANMRFGAVLVSDTPFGNADLAGARAIANTEQSFEVMYRQRQINVPLPTGTRGRYIRVTIKQISYLSIAEILVFSEQLFSVEVFNGGSPIPEGSYAPEMAFEDAFGGRNVYGEWVLSITDVSKTEVRYEKKSRRRELHHGAGAISDWTLAVVPKEKSTGALLPAQEMTFYVDMSATVLTLPKYGKLYEAEAFIKGELIEAKEGLEIFTGFCAPIDCAHKFGLGNILTTSKEGSVAELNKINYERNVIYVPNAHFRGVDSFTYRINIGTVPGEQVGTININVKKCRVDCRNDKYFGIRPTVDESLRTPWDHRGHAELPPDKFLQPDIYGAKLWNDPYCGNSPCNEFERTDVSVNPPSNGGVVGPS